MKISSFFNVFKANFITKKYIFLFFSYFITGICLVLFNFLLVNIFSEYEFGLFATLYAMCMVFSQITHAGTPSLILNKFGIGTLYDSGFLESLKKFLIINTSIISCFFIFIIPFTQNDISFNYFLMFLPLILIQSLFELVITKFQVNNKFNQLSFFNMVPNLSRLFLLISFYFLSSSKSFISFLQLYMLVNLFLLYFMIRNQNLSLKLFTKIGSLSIYLKNYFKFFLSTLKFGLYEILFIAYVQLPIIVVGLFYGFEEVASVALAITVINIFLMPSAVFQKVYTPEIHLSASKGSNLHKIVNNRFTLAMLIMGVLMSLLAYFFGKLIPYFFLDDIYSTSSLLIQVLSLYILFRYLVSPNSISLLTLNHTKALNKIIIGVILFQLIFLTYFLNWEYFKITHVAWIMVSTEILFFLLLRLYLSKNVFT